MASRSPTPWPLAQAELGAWMVGVSPGFVDHRLTERAQSGRMPRDAEDPALFGTAYMAAIKPFRSLIVYPAMMRQIEREWQPGTGERHRHTRRLEPQMEKEGSG